MDLKSFVPVILLAAMSACCHVKSTNAVFTAAYPALIQNEMGYITGLQLTDGAIMDNGQPEDNGTYRITPYNANIAARALLADATPANIAIVKKWMLWYFRKMNNEGSVNDHYTPSPADTSHYTTLEYDSMDAYAATFLSLARKLGETSADNIKWLQHNQAHLELIAGSLSKCFVDGGLTIAKTDYPEHYTMDNAEVNQGLHDIQWLIANQILAAGTWQQKLRDNTNSFNRLFNAQAGLYYYETEDKTMDWNRFYPFGTCQFFPAMYHVTDPATGNAKFLWDQFNGHYKNWAAGQVYTNDGTVWAEPAYAAVIMNDPVRANQYLKYIQDYVASNPGAQIPYWDDKAAAFVIWAAKLVK